MITVKEHIPESPAEGEVIDITPNDTNYLTHGFHKYPAKFIPHIPRWAIAKYGRADRPGAVLDPFCGSGTTLVESLLAGRNATGIDIDPLSALISKVKTTPVDIGLLEAVCNSISGTSLRKPDEMFMPAADNLSHWFTADVVSKLSAIRTAIEETRTRFPYEEMQDVYDLLIVCFSSIIRRVSNADNQSQKTYVSHTRPKVPEETLETWNTQLEYFRRRITEFSGRCSPETRTRILTASSDSLSAGLCEGPVAMVVTSPPYIKAVDYVYNQMIELFWIGDLFAMQTQRLQNEHKKQYIGTKQVTKKDYSQFDPEKSFIGIPAADAALQEIHLTDPRNGAAHAYITYRYFSTMERHFYSLAPLLVPGTPYVMVVGDSRVSGIHVPTAEILTGIASRHGLRAVHRWGYRIKNRYMRFDRKGRGGIINTDWVIEMIKE